MVPSLLAAALLLAVVVVPSAHSFQHSHASFVTRKARSSSATPPEVADEPAGKRPWGPARRHWEKAKAEEKAKAKMGKMVTDSGEKKG